MSLVLAVCIYAIEHFFTRAYPFYSAVDLQQVVKSTRNKHVVVVSPSAHFPVLNHEIMGNLGDVPCTTVLFNILAYLHHFRR
jgi:hypothetical protein